MNRLRFNTPTPGIPYGLTLVSAITDWDILQENLLASPCLQQNESLQFIFKQGYASAGQAYNEALAAARHDIVIFVHQDVYLPEHWLVQLRTALGVLDTIDPDWGVLGCYGRGRNHDKGIGWVYTTGRDWHGTPVSQPTQVDTLDEIVLILRPSSGLRFDARLPGFHLYGTDRCLDAHSRGMKNYVIPAPCIHNTHKLIELPPEYYRCYSYVKSKWKQYLPIPAPCGQISWLNEHIYWRRCRDVVRRWLNRQPVRRSRVRQPGRWFKDLCAGL